MMYQIKYECYGEQFVRYELPQMKCGKPESKHSFYRRVLGRIESITKAGGKIVDVMEIERTHN